MRRSFKFQCFFFVASVIIGIGIVCQIRVSDGQRLYVSPQTIEDYKTTISSEQAETERLRILVEEAKAKLSVYEEAEAIEGQAVEEVKKNLSSDVELYKMASGNQKVGGSGVEVIIDDGIRALFEGEDVNNVLVHDMDLMMVVNELKRYGAEVISVNGQRITANTAISCSGYTIRINGNVYARPFKVAAIGDGKRMAAALAEPESYATTLKQWGIQVEVRLKDNIVIDPIENEQKYRFASKIQREVMN